MIPPEIYDYAIIFFTAFGGMSLILGLAGFASAGVHSLLETIDDIKERIEIRKFNRELKQKKEEKA